MTGLILHLRDPASALTHGLWFVLAIPLLYRLFKASKDKLKRISFSIYGITLLACAAGSTVFHSVQGSTETIEWYNRLDHLGIGLLIAGTFTPIACHLLDARTGRRILAMIWGAALCASVLRMTVGQIPKSLAVSIYLVMGWSAIPAYSALCRNLSWKQARMIAEGGLFYTVGALIHWQNRPVLISGVFEAHDLFHVFVMMGSLRHYQFMSRAVLPSSIEHSIAGQFSIFSNNNIGGETQHLQLVLFKRPYLLKKFRMKKQSVES